MQLPDPIRKALVAGYYGCSAPWRVRNNARRAAAGQAPLLVLFYHRIADDRCVPWNHTNREFTAQIDWLKHRFEMISLAEVQHRIAGGFNDRPSACITFDDGYAENCDRALPLLIAEQIPCTYFVSSWFVQQQQPFPQDVARGVRLPPNTITQIRELSDSGIEIAGHTRTHPDMGSLSDPQQIYREVIGGIHDLEDIIGRPVSKFAFPFGLPRNMSTAVFQLCREHQIESVCSAYGDYNFAGDDSYHIRRFHADDMVRLRNWATVDPQKLRRRVNYNYAYASHAAIAETAVPA